MATRISDCINISPYPKPSPTVGNKSLLGDACGDWLQGVICPNYHFQRITNGFDIGSSDVLIQTVLVLV